MSKIAYVVGVDGPNAVLIGSGEKLTLPNSGDALKVGNVVEIADGQNMILADLVVETRDRWKIATAYVGVIPSKSAYNSKSPCFKSGWSSLGMKVTFLDSAAMVDGQQMKPGILYMGHIYCPIMCATDEERMGMSAHDAFWVCDKVQAYTQKKSMDDNNFIEDIMESTPPPVMGIFLKSEPTWMPEPPLTMSPTDPDFYEKDVNLIFVREHNDAATGKQFLIFFSVYLNHVYTDLDEEVRSGRMTDMLSILLELQPGNAAKCDLVADPHNGPLHIGLKIKAMNVRPVLNSERMSMRFEEFVPSLPQQPKLDFPPSFHTIMTKETFQFEGYILVSETLRNLGVGLHVSFPSSIQKNLGELQDAVGIQSFTVLVRVKEWVVDPPEIDSTPFEYHCMISKTGLKENIGTYRARSGDSNWIRQDRQRSGYQPPNYYHAQPKHVARIQGKLPILLPTTIVVPEDKEAPSEITVVEDPNYRMVRHCMGEAPHAAIGAPGPVEPVLSGPLTKLNLPFHSKPPKPAEGPLHDGKPPSVYRNTRSSQALAEYNQKMYEMALAGRLQENPGLAQCGESTVTTNTTFTESTEPEGGRYSDRDLPEDDFNSVTTDTDTEYNKVYDPDSQSQCSEKTVVDESSDDEDSVYDDNAAISRNRMANYEIHFAEYVAGLKADLYSVNSRSDVMFKGRCVVTHIASDYSYALLYPVQALEEGVPRWVLMKADVKTAAEKKDMLTFNTLQLGDLVRVRVKKAICKQEGANHVVPYIAAKWSNRTIDEECTQKVFILETNQVVIYADVLLPVQEVEMDVNDVERHILNDHVAVNTKQGYGLVPQWVLERLKRAQTTEKHVALPFYLVPPLPCHPETALLVYETEVETSLATHQI